MTSGILLALMMCAAQPAVAQDSRKIEDLSSKATAAYQAEDYDKALDLFLQAYELKPEPAMAYNVARAYEARKEYANAEKYYRIFVEAPDVNLDARNDALQRIKLMRELAVVESGSTEPTTPAASGGESVTVATRPEDSGQPADPIAPVDPDDNSGQTSSSQKSGPSPLTWVFLGTGAVALGAGTTFGVLANQSASQLSEACRGPNNTLCPESSSSTAEAMRSRALIADVSYATGGALVILGVVTWIVTSGKESDSSAHFAPVLTPSTVGGAWSVSF